MASVALTVDQKEQLRASSKFAAMIRSGAYSKATFWAVTTDPTAVPGGQTSANLIRWAKSRAFSVLVRQTPNMPENNVNFVNLFLQNLTQAVWDNVAIPSFNADSIIVAMEANAATLVDPAMDSTFDAMIQYSNF